MKAVVAAFNQVKALVGAFSVIVQLHGLIVCRSSPGPDLVNTNGRIMNHSSEPGSENQKTLNKGTQ